MFTATEYVLTRTQRSALGQAEDTVEGRYPSEGAAMAAAAEREAAQAARRAAGYCPCGATKEAVAPGGHLCFAPDYYVGPACPQCGHDAYFCPCAETTRQ